MNDYLKKIKQLIADSEAILIGAGAGLSTAAGFEYGGATFLKHFSYINKKYGYTDMYSAGFHNFSSPEEMWGYWSKFIYLNRYQGVKPLYVALYELFKDKNYFVLTTNVDHQFQLAGFDKNRLFYTQGDYGLFQCSLPCHKSTYDNIDIIKKMISSLDEDYKIPSTLIPTCPICGRQMSMNLRSDDTFVEDEGWHKGATRYVNFLKENEDKKLLLIELGVGFNTPGIIKYPFWQILSENKNAYLISINKGEAYVPRKIKQRVYLIDEDIKKIFMD